MPILKTKPVDIPAMASQLPRGMQWPAAALGSLAGDMFGGSTSDVAAFGPTPMMAGAADKGGGAIRELLGIIRDFKRNPADEALASKVTSQKVFHRTPINIPEGVELPPDFGPNYTGRPTPLVDKYVAQQTSMAQQADNFMPRRQGANIGMTGSGKMIRNHVAPAVQGLEDLDWVKSVSDPSQKASKPFSKPLSGRWNSFGSQSEDRSGTKLSTDAVSQIKAKLAAGDDIHKIASDHGVSPKTIQGIKAGATWNRVK